MEFLSFSVILITVVAANAKSLSSKSIRISDEFKSEPTTVNPNSLDSRCLDCICQKESNCNRNQLCATNPQQNNSITCGAFQIQKQYFQDCCTFLNQGNCDSDAAWQSCALDYNCAARCVTVCIIVVQLG